MLKAVTFDLWQTLIMDNPEGIRQSKAERVRRIGEILGEKQITFSAEEIGRAYKTEGERLAELWQTFRDIGARAQVKLLLEILGIDINDSRIEPLMDRLVEAYSLPILSDLPVPLDGAPDVLASLAGRGLRLGLICNTGRTPGKVLRIILERQGLAKYLSVQTFSDEVELRKPRPEIFMHTLNALGVQPSDALHVGDMLAADIIGARAVGMRAVHFCHKRGADTQPGDGETIYSLPELLPLIGGG